MKLDMTLYLCLLPDIIIQYSYNLYCDWLKNLQTIIDILPPTKYQKTREREIRHKAQLTIFHLEALT